MGQKLSFYITLQIKHLEHFVECTVILTQRLEQAGFMPKRSMIDRILGLWVLIERYLEYRRCFMAAYVDFKKAFNSVDREYSGTFFPDSEFMLTFLH